MKEFYSQFKDSYIQTFDDTKQGRSGFTLIFPMSEFFNREQEIISLNQRGGGVFFTSNPCKGGRKEENVTEIKWIYADIDDCTEKEMIGVVNGCPIPPNMIIFSGRGFHFYWKCDCTKEQFKKIISGIIFYFNSDPAISSTNEALRLPNFYHMKNPKTPKKVQLLRFDLSYQTNAEEMQEAYPEPIKQIQKKFNLQNDELAIIKNIPIKEVLQKLGVEVKRNAIWENGMLTSAMINEAENYINRFSGKDGSGSTIDAVITYGNKTKAEAIQWLKDMIGIKEESPERIAKAIVNSKQTIDNEIEKDVKIFTWGTNELDKRITPFQQNHFVIVAGNTGAGKTTFCFDVAYKNVIEGKKVLFLSLEMSEKEIYIRFARAYAGITKEEWRNRKTIPEAKKSAYNERLSQIENMNKLVLKGFPRGIHPTIKNIFAVINEVNPDLTFIDNFDLIWKDGKISEYTEQNRVASEIMNFCHDGNVPIVVLHHYKKTKDSGLNAIRGSGKITHNCDTALICSREYDVDAGKKENAKFSIRQEKDRDFGQLAFVEIYFKHGSFYDEFEEGKFEPWQNNI